MKSLSLISAAVLAALLAAHCSSTPAGEAVPPDKPEKPEKPTVITPSAWRPFRELQDVLYYESFEHPITPAEHGKIFTEDPAPPGGRIWKLESNQNESFMFLHVSNTQLKIPQGLNPNQIFIQFSVYSDDPATAVIKCNHQKGEYSKDIQVPKTKSWCQVTVKLSELSNKEKTHAESDQLIKDIEFHMHAPRGKKDVPKGFIDDILITQNVNPTELRLRVLLSEKRKLDMEKQFDRDGFMYTMAVNEFLKNATKPFKSHIKAKRVLIFGPNAEQTIVWRDQLKAAAVKAKEAGFIFEAADDPVASDKPVGGLSDMRTLLLFNLQKDPEFVILAPSDDEALAGGRPSEAIRVAALRALDSGSIPIVCIPGISASEYKEKMSGFAKTMESLCAQLGVPLVDNGWVFKNRQG